MFPSRSSCRQQVSITHISEHQLVVALRNRCTTQRNWQRRESELKQNWKAPSSLGLQLREWERIDSQTIEGALL